MKKVSVEQSNNQFVVTLWNEDNTSVITAIYNDPTMAVCSAHAAAKSLYLPCDPLIIDGVNIECK